MNCGILNIIKFMSFNGIKILYWLFLEDLGN